MTDNKLFKEANDLLDIHEVARYLGLEEKRGYINCPFHREKTGSLKLYSHNYYCFGCGASGDSISLSAYVWGISQFEALKRLNDTYSLNLSLGGENNSILRKKTKAHQESSYQEWYKQSLDLIAEFCRDYGKFAVFKEELAKAEDLHERLLITPPYEAYQLYNTEVYIYERRKYKSQQIYEVVGRRNWTTNEVLNVMG